MSVPHPLTWVGIRRAVESGLCEMDGKRTVTCEQTRGGGTAVWSCGGTPLCLFAGNGREDSYHCQNGAARWVRVVSEGRDLLCRDLSVLTEQSYRCRSTVCPQEDLQHHHRRQRVTAICSRGRYRSLILCMPWKWHLSLWKRLKSLPPCQRVHACAFSVAVPLAPAPFRASTARAAGSFILKGPWGWMPAVSAAAWWRWVPTHSKNISLALCARGRTAWIFQMTLSYSDNENYCTQIQFMDWSFFLCNALNICLF